MSMTFKNLSWLHFLKSSYALYCVLILHVTPIWAPANKAKPYELQEQHQILPFLQMPDQWNWVRLMPPTYGFEWGLLNKLEYVMNGLLELFFFFPLEEIWKQMKRETWNFCIVIFHSRELIKSRLQTIGSVVIFAVRPAHSPCSPQSFVHVWWINKWNMTIYTILYLSW